MKPLQKIFLVWLAWALIMVGFQAYVGARFEPKRPDYALSWTPGETTADSNLGKPYLLDPFLNAHVAWDSEFYLSIATVGYNDPDVRAIPSNYNWSTQQSCTAGQGEDCYSLNYAFFPFYPYVARLVALPFRPLPLTPIAASTLAAVIVSMLGALGGMYALYALTRDKLGEDGAVLAAFYLLIFPSSFFFAEVYTEGLFVGLAFGSLAFLKQRKWLWAGLLAAFAAWTRAAGALLFAPLILAWAGDFLGLTGAGSGSEKSRRKVNFTWRSLLNLASCFLPVLAYFIWKATLGESFAIVEERYFSRGILLMEQSMHAWEEAFAAFTSHNPQARAYYGVEFAAILFALAACLLTIRRYPLVSLFGLLVIFFSFTSGVAQGMHRYVLAAPSIFILLGRWGRNPAFDRVWTLTSLLMMGIMAAMFSFDFWAG
jgi:hypothetical protein